MAEPGDVVVSFDKIEELMAERRAAARDTVEKAEPAATEVEAPALEPVDPIPDAKEAEKTTEEKPQEEVAAEQKKSRRGRPPKAEKAEQAVPESDKEQTAAKPRRGRPPKADKAAPDEAQPPKPRDKVSRGKSRSRQEESPPEPVAVGGDTAPAAEIPAEPKEPAPPPRPIEEGKTVYIKLSELHPFHTFREHPFKVVDDATMMDLVETIKEHGVMTPATVRPEKDGTGYEIIAGHRRCRGSELAGVEELPCIVRDMTDVEAVREMKNSNKQRGDPLPSELAKLLDLEVEAIKHQGGRLDGVAPGDVGKRSVEIVGENNNMNYKKVMRYIRLNSLVPELLNKVDEKGLGFMPAVEISYIKPKNQRLIAVSIDGEQSSPSHAQAKRLRELDQEGKLNGDVIDGILSEKKKEDRGVIISMAELEKYFGKEVTPVKMKEQIMSLLDEWKEKQPPELAKPEKKTDLEK
ncbi:MAG: ParB/RepB/Spo0J family partition protein [Acutalibacteraceae bacterium]